MSESDRIAKALDLATRYGGIDGGHHKQWVIDQMVRALTGCPMVEKSATDYRGTAYKYEAQGESDEYSRWLVEFAAGEDGPHTYQWDVGIGP